MPEIIVHLPDGALLHLPGGTEPAQILASVRKYGDQQAAGAQQHTLDEGSLGKTALDTVKAIAHSPLDLLHSLVSGPPSLAPAPGEQPASFPKSLSEVGDSIKSRAASVGHDWEALGDPKVGGSVIGQLLMGLIAPRAVSAVKSALPEASTVGKGVESASRIIPKKILGTDVPMVREGVESFGKHLQSPEVNVPGYTQYGAVQKSGYVPSSSSTPASIDSISGVPYRGLEAGEEAPMGDLSSGDVSGLKKQGYSDEMIARIAKLDRPSVQNIGSQPEAPTPESVRRPSIAEQDNIDSHSSFGEGHVLPEALPTELRDAANDGLNFPSRGIYDVQSGKVEPFIKGLDGSAADVVNGVTKAALASPEHQAFLQSLKDSIKGLSDSASLGVPAPEADHQFTDFSNGVDEIVNQAGPEDLASSSPTGLGRSRLTNSWKDWLQKRGQSTPGWPFKELPQ